ncbi:exonuclease domain-containing protein [Sphingobacterium thalpophilum]|uniref:DNA polymerase III polC-type n=1 Tax=Sphingobacterium thalpophilum TaxID=259 RepID=A0A4U9VXR3_9SPHI|nr:MULTISPECIES: 3'-5' exonuclease [Sphingobacterium]MCW8311830.1 DNA polymerase III subunit epsilon [Sphingobacterium sp. InxBP1]VTR52465.1 DNA polymerase III polC-type [Sphingobacterium thalpophilum]
MELKLKRPLVFFDLETTGVNVATDRIVEVSFLKVMPNGEETVYTKRINPERPIPPESSFFHGIYDEDIKDAPTFKAIATELAAFIGDGDLAGYNSNKFDVPMLMEEFLRAGVDFSLEGRSFVDVQNIFHQMEQRTLKAAYKFYCNAELENAHTAEADVRATYEVLKAQLTKYEGAAFEDRHGTVTYPVVNDVDALHEFTNLSKPVDFAGRIVYNEDGLETINFGKHKGRPIIEVFEQEPSYYAWMQNGDFPLYTKKVLENIWIRYKKEKNEQKAKVATSQSSEEKKLARNEYNRQKEEVPQPISLDMLKELQDKFKK